MNKAGNLPPVWDIQLYRDNDQVILIELVDSVGAPLDLSDIDQVFGKVYPEYGPMLTLDITLVERGILINFTSDFLSGLTWPLAEYDINVRVSDKVATLVRGTISIGRDGKK